MLEKVEKWLIEQGFSLEMRTASAFREVGFEVRQSTLYRDPETEKSREVDVYAIDPDDRGILGISFVVECKAAVKPWVLLCSPHTLSGYNRLLSFSVASTDARGALGDRFEDLVGNLPWLRKEGLIGYSLRQAFSDNDAAYAAAMSVAKAADFQVNKIAGHVPKFCFVFPVIVVDSPLILCSMSEAGQIVLKEAEQGEFLFHADPPRNFGTCIRVVKSTSLPGFAAEAKQVANQLRAGLTTHVDEAWAIMCSPDKG